MMKREQESRTGKCTDSDSLLDAQANMPLVEGPAMVLLLSADPDATAAIAKNIQDAGHRCMCADSVQKAQAELGNGKTDLLLLDTALKPDVLEMIPDAQAHCPWLRVIAWSLEPDPDATIAAIRKGATDYLHLPGSLDDLPQRISRVVAQGRSHRQREQRLHRLMKSCESLRASKDEMSQQVDVLCGDLASAYRTIKDQLSIVEMTTEFRTLISQELDVEDMLRISLEYILGKTGPTNGVVYLREAEAEFGIGAFVNYEWQDRNIMPSLEALGHLVCEPMEREPGLMKFEDAESFARSKGVDPDLFDKGEIVAFSCHRNTDCLAVVVLFRDKEHPFTDEVAGMLDALRDILAEQLGRILRVHKRSTFEWPEQGTDDSDWGDQAA